MCTKKLYCGPAERRPAKSAARYLKIRSKTITLHTSISSVCSVGRQPGSAIEPTAVRSATRLSGYPGIVFRTSVCVLVCESLALPRGWRPEVLRPQPLLPKRQGSSTRYTRAALQSAVPESTHPSRTLSILSPQPALRSTPSQAPQAKDTHTGGLPQAQSQSPTPKIQTTFCPLSCPGLASTPSFLFAVLVPLTILMCPPSSPRFSSHSPDRHRARVVGAAEAWRKLPSLPAESSAHIHTVVLAQPPSPFRKATHFYSSLFAFSLPEALLLLPLILRRAARLFFFSRPFSPRASLALAASPPSWPAPAAHAANTPTTTPTGFKRTACHTPLVADLAGLFAPPP